MKHAYSFLAGVALVSLCVISTRSLPGYMFGLGFLVCFGSGLLLHFKGILRFVPYWSNGTERPSSTTQRRTRQSPEVSGGSVVSRFSSELTKPVRAQAGVSGSHGYTSSPVCRQASRCRENGRKNSGSPLRNGRERNHGRRSGTPVQRNELPARHYSRTARNAASRSVVQSSNVLSTVQQEVLSALCNLKVPFGEAEQAVHSAAKEHGGESFDVLFRAALNLVNAGVGKSRKAAA